MNKNHFRFVAVSLLIPAIAATAPQAAATAPQVGTFSPGVPALQPTPLVASELPTIHYPIGGFFDSFGLNVTSEIIGGGINGKGQPFSVDVHISGLDATRANSLKLGMSEGLMVTSLPERLESPESAEHNIFMPSITKSTIVSIPRGYKDIHMKFTFAAPKTTGPHHFAPTVVFKRPNGTNATVRYTSKSFIVGAP